MSIAPEPLITNLVQEFIELDPLLPVGPYHSQCQLQELRYRQDLPIHRQPSIGTCTTVSIAFCLFLRKSGLGTNLDYHKDATEFEFTPSFTKTGYETWNELYRPVSWFGYKNIALHKGLKSLDHATTLILTPEQIFSIDFSAAQFGFLEFPLIKSTTNYRIKDLRSPNFIHEKWCPNWISCRLQKEVIKPSLLLNLS